MRHPSAAVVIASLALQSCARAPALDILGSFFPVWIFCILLGIAAAVLARQLILRLGPDVDYGPPVLIYPSLVVLFACLIWLLFFR